MRAIATLCAFAMLACATRRGGDVTGAQRALAREMIAQRQWSRAFSLSDSVCRAAPDRADGYLLRGTVYREQGLATEAEADLKQAVQLDDTLAAAHSALAILYDTEGRGEEGLAQHRRAAELDPRNAQFLNNLGFSLFAHGRARDAIPVLHEALRLAPADARIRNNLGFAYAAAGDFARAAEQFGRGGTPAEAKNNLGWAYERRGALAQAFDEYVAALRCDPNERTARENLTRVARALNRDIPADVNGSGS